MIRARGKEPRDQVLLTSTSPIKVEGKYRRGSQSAQENLGLVGHAAPICRRPTLDSDNLSFRGGQRKSLDVCRTPDGLPSPTSWHSPDFRPWSAPSGAFGSATAQRAALRHRQSSRASLNSVSNLLTVPASPLEYSTPIHSPPPSPTVPRASTGPLHPPPQRTPGSPHLAHSCSKSPHFTFQHTSYIQSAGTPEFPQKVMLGALKRGTRSPIGPASSVVLQPLRGRQHMGSTGLQSRALQQHADDSEQPKTPQAIAHSLVTKQAHPLGRSYNFDTNQEFQDRTCTETEGGFGLEALALGDASPCPRGSPAGHPRPSERAGPLAGCHATSTANGSRTNAWASSATPIKRDGQSSEHPHGCTGTLNEPSSTTGHGGLIEAHGCIGTLNGPSTTMGHGGLIEAQGGYEAQCSMSAEQCTSTKVAAASGCAPKTLSPAAEGDAGGSLVGWWAVWEDETRQVMDWAGLDVDWLRTDLLPYAEGIIGSPTSEGTQPVVLRKGRRYGWHQHYRA